MDPHSETFSMPMMRDFIPEWLRPWIYMVFAFLFQMSAGAYLGAMNFTMSERAWMREDMNMCLYASLAGMSVYFPLLFRFKFRFSNKYLLTWAALTIAICNILFLYCTSLPVVWLLCIFAGMGKIQGTFECMSTTQLWMTPKRDFRIFFPILHIFILGSIEYAGYLAASMAEHTHWQLMYVTMAAAMLLIVIFMLTCTRHTQVLPHILPLKGIDFTGGIMWLALTLQVSYILTYGEWLDWWTSPRIQLLTGTSVATFALCLHRMFLLGEKSYYETKVFSYRQVFKIFICVVLFEIILSTHHVLDSVLMNDILGYEELTSESTNFYAMFGVLVGCVFALGWYRVCDYTMRRMVAVSLLAAAAYQACIYFQCSDQMSLEMFYFPMFLRGFATATLSITVLLALHRNLPFQHFFQGLSLLNILHTVIGGALGAALFGRFFSYYMADNANRFSGYISSVNQHVDYHNVGQVIGRFYYYTEAVCVKEIYGFVLIGTLATAILFFVLDIRVFDAAAKRFPSWLHLGNQVAHKMRKIESQEKAMQ